MKALVSYEVTSTIGGKFPVEGDVVATSSGEPAGAREPVSVILNTSIQYIFSKKLHNVILFYGSRSLS